MNTKKYYIDLITNFVGNKMTSEEIDKWAQKEFERHSKIKNTPNAVHINYYEGIITASEIETIEKELAKLNLDLSLYNKSGVIYNSIFDLTSLVSVALGDELTKNIIYEVVGGAVWDGIKNVIYRVFNKTKNQTINNYSVNKVIKTKVTFGVNFRLNKNQGLYFNFKGSFNKEKLHTALDQTKEIIKEISPDAIGSEYLEYDHKNKYGEKLTH